METNKKVFFVFIAISALFGLITLLYLPQGIIIQFNQSADGVSEFSKFLVLVVFGLATWFVAVQLKDEKNKGDYTRWYIVSAVVVGLELLTVIINI
ncbi:hypothetical protein KHQ88_04925 [Mycoplasmatota bacterium]|nr:hypothetical protein KHQ88_04925 [Mycoplasmatota bacterium]